MKKSIKERFDSKYIVDPSTDCWLWQGTLKRTNGGYGSFTIGRSNQQAHRMAYILYNGAIPADMLVCHACDVRRCVNPKHLFLGTNQDNMTDRNIKNRQAHLKGETNGNSTLTSEQVLDIRKRYIKGHKHHNRGNCAELALEFGIDNTTVHSVVKRKIWKHI